MADRRNERNLSLRMCVVWRDRPAWGRQQRDPRHGGDSSQRTDVKREPCPGGSKLKLKVQPVDKESNIICQISPGKTAGDIKGINPERETIKSFPS